MGEESSPTEDETGNDTESAFESARAEKEAIYPDVGFVLAKIDMMKPPGEALLQLDHGLLLSELTLPPATELTDYVIYDTDGHNYGHQTLEEVEDRVESQEVPGLVADLRSESLRDRRLALFGLSQLAEVDSEACLDAVSVIREELHGSPVDIQVGALAVLQPLVETHPEQVSSVVPAVVSVLDSATESRVQRDAIQFLAAVAEHDASAVVDAVPVLTACLQDGCPAENLALTTLHRVAQEYPDSVVPAASELLDYVADSDDPQRVGALATLGAIAKEYPDVAASTIPHATALLDDDADEVRANATGLLADLADEYPDRLRDVVPRATELLTDPDEKARYNATSILARIAKSSPEAVEPAVDELVDALDDDLEHTRANACWALGYVSATPALARLEEHEQSDPSDEVRTAAGFAVDAIRDGP